MWQWLLHNKGEAHAEFDALRIMFLNRTQMSAEIEPGRRCAQRAELNTAFRIK